MIQNCFNFSYWGKFRGSINELRVTFKNINF